MSESEFGEAGEVTELLQQLIRNACVNDGTTDSGGESRNADLLTQYLDGTGVALETFEPVPGRATVVARAEGSDPEAPTLLYLGHTDVVPVNADNWHRDPFGGELVEGEVWGRGAVDMLNLTAAMAVAFRRHATDGKAHRGTLLYCGVADEEALGTHGAGWLIDNALDSVRCDYVITESGGIPLETPGGTRLPVVVGEKGCYWCTLVVRGTAGHASTPLRTDNALVTAAEVVRRITEYRPRALIGESWRRLVDGLGLPDEIAAAMLDPDSVLALVEALPDLGLARQAHASTHATCAPTVIRGGTKTNVIPDTVELELDIRTLPGQSVADIEAMLQEMLGDLAPRVEIRTSTCEAASESPTETPLWDVLARLAPRFHEGASTIPILATGATDARFFRRAGTVSYGYGMFSKKMTFGDYTSMFHGADERVDVESLGLSVELFSAAAGELLA